MRLLHTSDWHLGRTFHGAGLADAQHAAVDAIVELVRDERVDVVVVAGDLYDRALPPAEAVALLSDALQRIRRAGAQVVATAGNHDSGARLGFAGALLADAGVHLWGDVRRAGAPVLLEGRDGQRDLALYPVPYLEPEAARHQLGVPDVRTHEGVLGVALERARADAVRRVDARTVAVVHAFVSGGTPCDSERVLRVGGSDRVSIPALGGFDYVALGHLHGAQVLDDDGRVRYSGSPVAYSFSERAHRKGVWLVELAHRPPRARFVPLPVTRGLAELRGRLDDLLRSRAFADAERCWVSAALTDQVLPREPMTRLRARFPHAVVLRHEPPVAPGAPGAYTERVRGRGDVELVSDFLTHVTGQRPSRDEHEDCVAAIDAVLATDGGDTARASVA